MERIAVDDGEYERVEQLVDLQRSEPPLARLVDGLGPGEREAVLARVVDERSYAEIAAAQSVSREVARQRVSRGLARLAAWSREGRR
jgi:DNA-directed RNA polymerase specialized sigma24 family protein